MRDMTILRVAAIVRRYTGHLVAWMYAHSYGKKNARKTVSLDELGVAHTSEVTMCACGVRCIEPRKVKGLDQ